jgi:imidazole glycerol-phosphate synthase subunit HisH
MIVIVNYGMGNLRSIHNKLARLGIAAVVSDEAPVIEQADKLILPGVGAFAAGMRNLESHQLITVLNWKVREQRTPVLGICLGMQLFSARSEEGNANGLGWLDAETIRFDFRQSGQNLQVPHVGWNTLRQVRECHLLATVAENQRFYFSHSYHVHCYDAGDIVATSCYGYDFVSVIRRDNIYGVQFHPEKSHQRGLELVVAFVNGGQNASP